MNKIISVVMRDLKIALSDPMGMWLVIAPILLAVVIVLISPGISDTSVILAVDKNFEAEQLEDFAKIEVFDTLEQIEERVMRRDEVIGIVSKGEGFELLAQGNESESSINLSKVIVSLDELDSLVKAGSDKTRLNYLSFGEDIPPLKLALSTTLVLMATIVAGMLTSLGIVDEKTDRTIRAANVTPIKQTTYVIAKSIIGFLTLIITSVVSLIILGLYNINWIQMLLMILSCGVLSIIVAFAIGLVSKDFIEAAGSIKILILPLIASVIVYEIVDPKWHFTVMWSPFYWANKGLNEIINHTATWGDILLYTGIILLICGVVFKLVSKVVRKQLN